MVYWPSITNDIGNVVRSCATCAERLPSHAPEPLLVEPPPSRPFECAASDLFQLAGHHFLVYTDRFSGWPTVSSCGRTVTSTQVISLLKEWTSEKGIPVRLTTDGGPQFTSRAFKEFCASWGICHTISSPHHHEANGAAEAAVKAIKALLGKTTRNGNVNVDAFRTGLLEFRTPRALTGSAHPSCCLGAIFGGKCCHTPAHSSSNGASSGTLWTGQPHGSQLKPRSKPLSVQQQSSSSSSNRFC